MSLPTSTWGLEADANRIKKTYVKGYMDVSGGELSVHNTAFNVFNSAGDGAFRVDPQKITVKDDTGQIVDISLSYLSFLNNLVPADGQAVSIPDKVKYIFTSGTETRIGKPDASSNFRVYGNTYIEQFLFVGMDASFGQNVDISGSLNVKTHFKLPVGSTNQRPITINEALSAGYIRYNTDNHQFEGYGPGNSWGSLGGVINVSQNTKVIASSPNPDSSNNELQFFTAPTGSTLVGDAKERMRILANGDVSMNERLLVGRDVSLNGNLYVASRSRFGGDLSLNGNFAMYGGDASLNGLLLVGRDASLNGNLFVASRSRFGGDLSLNGNFAMYGGDASLNGLLLVGRDASLNGNLYVASRTRLSGDLSLNGNFAMYGGDASLNGLLLVGRDASLNGNLYVASRSRFGGDLSLNGNFAMYGGDASLNGLLLVGQDASLNGNLYVASRSRFGGDLSLNGNFAMYGGDASLNGLLLVGRDASLNGNLYVISRSRFGGDLSLNGNFAMYGGDASLNGLLLVGRDASLNGNLYIAPNRSVGIGRVAESTYALDVNGTIFGNSYSSTNFTIVNSDSDSVFESRSSSGRMYFRPLGGGTTKGIQIDNNTGNIGIKKDPDATYELDVNGEIQATSYNATSDYRIKTDVKALDLSFNVDGLKPVTYKNVRHGRQDVGFIAHEIQEYFPFLVNGEKDGEQMQSLNYIGLIGILTKEIQDLKKRLAETDAKIASLETNVGEIGSKIEDVDIKITSIGKDIDGVETRFDNIETKVVLEQARLSICETGVAFNKSAIDDINRRFQS